MGARRVEFTPVVQQAAQVAQQPALEPLVAQAPGDGQRSGIAVVRVFPSRLVVQVQPQFVQRQHLQPQIVQVHGDAVRFPQVAQGRIQFAVLGLASSSHEQQPGGALQITRAQRGFESLFAVHMRRCPLAEQIKCIGRHPVRQCAHPIFERLSTGTPNISEAVIAWMSMPSANAWRSCGMSATWASTRSSIWL